jgi:hypothetical protein
MWRLFAAVGACALVSGLAVGRAGDGPPTHPATPAAAQIQVLIDQLGSERFSDREAAVAALEKIGPAATNALQAAATRGESPEIRERAANILIKIKRGAESGVRLTAKRVKLEYKNIPLGTAVNDLKARTGLNISLDPNRVANPLRQVTCETAELPVWEALEAFCVAAGLRETFQQDLDLPRPTGPRRGYVPPPPTPNADAVAVVLVDGRPDRLPGDRSTAVRVVALPPSFPGHKVTLGTGEVTLCLDVTPAPGLNWQDIAGVKITRLIDGAGRPGGAGTEKNPPQNFDPSGMVVFARPGLAMRFDMNGNPIPPETAANPRVVTVPLKLGTPSARTLKRLEGAVYGEVQVPNQHLITVTDPKKNTSTWHNGPNDLRFSVLEVKEATRPGEMSVIRVQFEQPSAFVLATRRRGGWNPGWPEAPQRPGQGNTVQAFDAAGKPFPTVNNGVTDMSDDGMISIQTMQFSFRKEAGLPAKLVVVGPKTVLVEVPFVMENVTLP